MTDDQRRSCRSAARKPTISDYIGRGLRRLRSPMVAVVGAVCQDAGRYARFSLKVKGEAITEVRFQASPCVTLLAYCELAAETVSGHTLPAAARRICALNLSAELPLVPAAKRDRALLASQAPMATIIEVKRTHAHEGRLHLRHPTPYGFPTCWAG